MDLGDQLEKVENLQNKEFNVFGIKVTPVTIGAAVTLVSSVVGLLYGGFLMYQKVEEVANLDLGAYQQEMKVMNEKIEGLSAKTETTVDYARDIKNNLRNDILRIEKVTERSDDKVQNLEEKVRKLIDDAEARFEAKRDQLRSSQTADMKELEARLNAKVQQALDNPLAK